MLTEKGGLYGLIYNYLHHRMLNNMKNNDNLEYQQVPKSIFSVKQSLVTNTDRNIRMEVEYRLVLIIVKFRAKTHLTISVVIQHYYQTLLAI